tara:strand:+ start:2601 stop:4019 length:1419 start_codon:yes stop_codon:yes gene_type:complete
MLTPDEKFNIIKQSLKDGFKGSVSDLIDKVEKESLGVDKVANTEKEKTKGLRGDTKGMTMAFPNSNENFNTKGMEYPIDIKKIDQQGNIVRSYKDVPPGIENLPMGDKTGTVIESASEYQEGGEKGKSDPGFDSFMKDVEARMVEKEKEFNARNKTFDSPNKFLYQKGGQRIGLVKNRFKVNSDIEEFLTSDLAEEHLTPQNTYKSYRSKYFQSGGLADGETNPNDGMFYPNPNLKVKPQVLKEMGTRAGLLGNKAAEFAKNVMSGKIWEDGTEVNLKSTTDKYFEKKGYKSENMYKIMDFIGQHESGNNYESVQVSQKDNGELYDGPGRGRYQFENTKSGGGITAVNRTARGVKSLGLAQNYKREDGPFANIFDAFYGKYDNQASQKEIDLNLLTPEEQDFIFIFNYLNGKEGAKSDLEKLLLQEEEVTSDQIFDFWLKHHKVSSDLGKDEEYKRWQERTKVLSQIVDTEE